MKYQMKVLLLWAFSASSLWAQPNLFSTANLTFQSPFERAAFAQPNDVLPLLLSVNQRIDSAQWQDIRDKIGYLFSALEEEGIRGKKYKKASKIIFEKIHQARLRHYREYAEFHEIFETGVYNCVTASALYALIFEHFEIPYEIRQMPGHVYLVMDPAGEHLVIEATDPVNGVYSVSPAQKEKYVRMLGRMKLIPDAEIQTVPTDQLYQRYIARQEQTIQLRQLAGDLYFNNALKWIEQNDTRTALVQLDKALFLFPQELGGHLRNRLLVQLTTEVRADNPESYFPLFQLLESPFYRNEARDDIKSYLYQASEKYLIAENVPEKYTAVYAYFTAHLPAADTVLVNEVKKIHHLQLARRAEFQFDRASMTEHLDSAWIIAPKDLQIQSIITNVILGELNGSSFAEPERLNARLDSLVRRYPFVENNPKIKEARLMTMAVTVGQYFENNQPEKGFAGLEEFRRSVEGQTDKMPRASEMVALVYGEISSYYVRKDKLNEARDWLKRGLELAPRNEDLLRKKEAFEDYDLKYKKGRN